MVQYPDFRRILGLLEGRAEVLADEHDLADGCTLLAGREARMEIPAGPRPTSVDGQSACSPPGAGVSRVEGRGLVRRGSSCLAVATCFALVPRLAGLVRASVGKS